MSKRASIVSWLWLIIGVLYLALPLVGTFIFSLQKQRGQYNFAAYQSAFADPQFAQTFLFSVRMSVLTIVLCLVLIVPTAYWVQLRTPHLRPLVELVTLLPFVIPAIILVFGLIKTYSKTFTLFGIPLMPSLTNTTWSTDILLVCGYVVLALPYFYRSVDTGLRAMDVRTLTEAAQSLGASWTTILLRIILPNLRTSLLSGALLTFATVIGELTLATFLARPAFGPYLAQLGNHLAYEPAALSIVSFGLTWLAMGIIQWITHGSRQSNLAGAR